MTSYVSDKSEIKEICIKIALEIDAPKGYLNWAEGTGENSDNLYFYIKDQAFAAYIPMIRLTKLSVKKKYAKNSEFITQRFFQETTYDYIFTLGMDCPCDFVHGILKDTINECLESSGSDPFGCCSSYIECSNAKRCITPFKEIRYDCQYRRNLLNGNVFYGENPTVLR